MSSEVVITIFLKGDTKYKYTTDVIMLLCNWSEKSVRPCPVTNNIWFISIFSSSLHRSRPASDLTSWNTLQALPPFNNVVLEKEIRNYSWYNSGINIITYKINYQ